MAKFTTTALLAGAAAVALAACETTVRDDGADPSIRLTIGRIGEAGVYTRDPDPADPLDFCVAVPGDGPVPINVVASDGGGLAGLSLRVVFAEFVDESVSSAPDAPDATRTIETIRGGQAVIVELPPSSAGGAGRTGAAIAAEVVRDAIGGPFIVGVVAVDQFGNRSFAEGIEVRRRVDVGGVFCRNGRGV